MRFNVKTSRGLVSVDTDVLREVLDRWKAVCGLSARLVAELEDCEYDIAQAFDTEELWHHATSDYATELQLELRELIDDLEAT